MAAFLGCIGIVGLAAIVWLLFNISSSLDEIAKAVRGNG